MKGHNADPIDRLNRPLCSWVISAHGFDRVSDELQPNRLRFARRKDVDDSAADRELAVLVGGVLARKACIDEELRKVGRRDFLAWLQVERGTHQPSRRGHAGQQRRSGRDDDADLSAAHRVQRAGPRRRHADVRLQPAIWVDLMRGKRQHGSVRTRAGHTLQSRQEERDILDRLFDLAVARHDVPDDTLGTVLRGRSHKQRFGWGRET